MANWKTYKIIDKEINWNLNFIKFDLDGDVTYQWGEQKSYIYCINEHSFRNYDIGDYLKIDLDDTRYESSTRDFTTRSVKKGNSSEILPDFSNMRMNVNDLYNSLVSNESGYKSLSEWCRKGEFNGHYNAESRLTKMGFSDQLIHELELPDIRKVLECEDIAKRENRIKYNLSGKIEKISFFTPEFDEYFDCAVALMSNKDIWVIAYKPLIGMSNGQDKELVVEKVYNSYSDNEAASEFEKIVNHLNHGSHPILGLATSYRIGNVINLSDIIRSPYVQVETLSSRAKDYPDQYLLPLDIIKRPMAILDPLCHFAIYLGNGKVAHLTGFGGTKLDTWRNFYEPVEGEGGKKAVIGGTITRYHAPIPFKKKDEIINHIIAAIDNKFGRVDLSNTSKLNAYSVSNNCEHLVNNAAYDINAASQISSENRSFNFEKELERTNKVKELTATGESLAQVRSAYDQTMQAHQVQRTNFSSMWKVESYPKPWCNIQ